MWIQLIAFPRLDGQYLMDAALDVVRWQLGAATIAKRSFSEERRLVRKNYKVTMMRPLGSSQGHQNVVCRIGSVERFQSDLEQKTAGCP